MKEEGLKKGFLHSCIGYDLDYPKAAFIRASDSNFLTKNQWTYQILDATYGHTCLEGDMTYVGSCWGSYWSKLDFTELNTKGTYFLVVYRDGNEYFRSDIVEIGYHILLAKTYEKVGITAFEKKEELAKNKVGWLDCGSDFKECNSHTTAIIGLCEFYNTCYEMLTEDQNKRFIHQLIVGCEQLCVYQDRATQIGLPVGSVVHEANKNAQLILGDMAQFVVAMALSSRLLCEVDFNKSGEYLRRAKNCMDYLLKEPPLRVDGFNHWNHGAPDDYIPNSMMTRDLLMQLWGCLELYKSGLAEYKTFAIEFAEQVMERQVPKEEAEGGFYGHFYEFADKKFTEKANVHHHICCDTGATFPYFIVPFFELMEVFVGHKERERWKNLILNFGEGFLLPACKQNPFYLMPMGYFHNEGLLNFCGPWHGANASIPLCAVLATKLEGMTGNKEYREIATGNVQWIAGLHSGINEEILSSSVRYKEAIPNHTYVPISHIDGIGTKSGRAWKRIEGTICNGFCANPQFTHTVYPCVANDVPKYFCDEDWIPHSGAWLYALGVMRVENSWKPSYCENKIV